MEFKPGIKLKHRQTGIVWVVSTIDSQSVTLHRWVKSENTLIKTLPIEKNEIIDKYVLIKG